MANPVIVQVEGNLQWRAWRGPSRRWIAVCDAMDLTMEADTLDELHGVIDEAVHLLLIDLLQDNELDQFLKERGWRASQIPVGREVEDVEFKLPPLNLLFAENARDSKRRAC